MAVAARRAFSTGNPIEQFNTTLTRWQAINSATTLEEIETLKTMSVAELPSGGVAAPVEEEGEEEEDPDAAVTEFVPNPEYWQNKDGWDEFEDTFTDNHESGPSDGIWHIL